MMLKNCAKFLLSASVFVAATLSHAGEAEQKAYAMRLIDQLQIVEQQLAVAKNARDIQAQQINSKRLPDSVGQEANVYLNNYLSILEKSLQSDRLKEQYAEVYMKMYTEEELQTIVMFYDSPAGQKFIANQPVANKSVLNVVQREFTRLQPQLQKITKDFEQKVKAKLGK